MTPAAAGRAVTPLSHGLRLWSFAGASALDRPARGARPRPWWWAASIFALTLSLAAFQLSWTEADPDLWGHLRFGLDHLTTGRVDRPDVYSYLTQNGRWINHEWLAETVMALAYVTAGPAGIAAVKLGLGLALVVLMWRWLRSRGVSALASGLMVTYGMVPVYPGLGSLRPQAFTYVAFFLTALLIARADTGARRHLWLAVPLFALWSNLHGGVAAGVGILLLWSVARVVTSAGRSGLRAVPRELRGTGLPACGAVAATLVNPYGTDLWGFLARNVGARPDIAEWQPIELVGLPGAIYLALLGASIAGLCGSWRPRSAALIAVFVACACAPLLAVRHLALFGVIAIVVAGEHAADAFGRWSRSADESVRVASGERHLPAAAGMLAVGAAVLIALAVPRLGRVEYRASAFPVQVVEALRAGGVEGRMVTFFDWGEYAIWHLAPKIAVSLDGRRETVYTESIRAEAQDLLWGRGDWEAALARGDPELALVSTEYPGYGLLRQHPNWALLFQDGTSALFGRRGTQVMTSLQGTVLPPPLPPGVRRPFP